MLWISSHLPLRLLALSARVLLNALQATIAGGIAKMIATIGITVPRAMTPALLSPPPPPPPPAAEVDGFGLDESTVGLAVFVIVTVVGDDVDNSSSAQRICNGYATFHVLIEVTVSVPMVFWAEGLSSTYAVVGVLSALWQAHQGAPRRSGSSGQTYTLGRRH